MKKETYVDKISKKLALSKKDVNNVVNEFLEELKKEILINDKVNITNFGSFSKSKSKIHAIFSPVDGSILPEKEYYRISFIISKEFKKMLHGDDK